MTSFEPGRHLPGLDRFIWDATCRSGLALVHGRTPSARGFEVPARLIVRSGARRLPHQPVEIFEARDAVNTASPLLERVRGCDVLNVTVDALLNEARGDERGDEFRYRAFLVAPRDAPRVQLDALVVARVETGGELGCV